jgi:sulfoacetaldehyde dehydrogenase
LKTPPPADKSDHSQTEASAQVATLMNRARAAQALFAKYDQAAIDEVVTAVGWTLLRPENNRRLAEQAVADTGLGRVKDKITKNHRKTLGLLRDLSRARTVGVIAEHPQKGLIEIARPVGVVGAVVPSTNPVATPYNKVLNALKCGNAIILAPSPKGQAVCGEVLCLMHQALETVGAPRDLVQMLPFPASKATTYELMRQVDLIVVTGSQANVRAAYQSGSPAIGVGAGNAPVIVDETADIAGAAKKITVSKTFDNATSCSAENSLVIVDAVYYQMVRALCTLGARLITNAEKPRLRHAMWPDGKLNPQITAKTADEILRVAGLEPGSDPASILLVEDQTPTRNNPFANEKLSPVLTLYRAKDIAEATTIVHAILGVNGAGHSVGIHTARQERALQLGLELPVCRIIVNQAHGFATGGSFDNGLPFSLSMGCGTWGENSISDNMNYRHYLNTTRIVGPIPTDEPTLDEIFGDYWRKYNITP